MTSTCKEVDAILKKYGVFIDCAYDKVRCVLTGHELKPTLNALKQYIESPKFISAYEVHEILMKNPDVFEPLNKNLLGCKYTHRVLARDRQTLLNHLNGKLFVRRKARALNGELASETEEEENPETLTASNAEPIIEAQYEDDEDDSDNEEDDEIIEIDDDEEEEEEEEEEDDDEETYPELSKKRKGSKPVAEDSYDFSVMDTDKDSGRKRKTPGKGVADKKKKAKK